MSELPEAYRHLPTFSFGDNPALADELAALVIAGRKTATCTFADDPEQSRPGMSWIVLDGEKRPVCVIETMEITFRRYDEVDPQFAHDEGEGDRSLAFWRKVHRAYFTRSGKFSEDMMLCCERFRLVETLVPAEATS